MPYRKVDEGEPEENDTEGNMPFKRGVIDGESEDTEGNAVKSGRDNARPAKDDSDDTDGNGARFRPAPSA